MINEVMTFFKERLNGYIRLKTAADEDKVVFTDGSQTDTVSFELNRITPLLMNIEEERQLRPDDLYSTRNVKGKSVKVQPEIRFNLFILYTFRFKNYEESMRYLSLLMKYFQANRVFDHHNSPDLSPEVEKLWVELVTMPFAQQNDLWNALRTTHLPSILYRVKMLTYLDEEAVTIMPEPSALNTALHKLD